MEPLQTGSGWCSRDPLNQLLPEHQLTQVTVVPVLAVCLSVSLPFERGPMVKDHSVKMIPVRNRGDPARARYTWGGQGWPGRSDPANAAAQIALKKQIVRVSMLTPVPFTWRARLNRVHYGKLLL